jgi:DNA-binding CsgD family transcriptional regulator
MPDVDRLTSMQKDCLRLVHQHMSSKDIAKRLGTSPHTVDNHIKAAMARLGVTSRWSASKICVENDDLNVRRALVSQPPAVAKSANNTALSPTSAEDGAEGGGSKGQSFVGTGNRRFLPLPAYWGEQNQLPSVDRILWVVGLAIALCVAVAAITSSIEVLGRLI